MGAHVVHRLRGDHDAAVRLARGAALAASGCSSRRSIVLHDRVRAVRACGFAVPDRSVPHDAGARRRCVAAAVASHPARHQSEGKTRARHGHLGHGRRARPDPGPADRRLADRGLQLALGVLRQRAVRHSRGDRYRGDAARDDRNASCASTCSASRRSAWASARCR